MEYTYDGRPDIGGQKTHDRATEYAAATGVTYEVALNLVMAEQREYSAENFGWPMPNDMNAPHAMVDAWNSVSRTAADAGNSAVEVARRINAIYDLNTISLAAQFAIERRANQLGANLSPGTNDRNLSVAYGRVAADMPATWAIYSFGGEMTPDAAREMFFAKFSESRSARVESAPNGTTWYYKRINGRLQEVKL